MNNFYISVYETDGVNYIFSAKTSTSMLSIFQIQAYILLFADIYCTYWVHYYVVGCIQVVLEIQKHQAALCSSWSLRDNDHDTVSEHAEHKFKIFLRKPSSDRGLSAGDMWSAELLQLVVQCAPGWWAGKVSKLKKTIRSVCLRATCLQKDNKAA